MCSITIELRRRYGVNSFTVSPVIAKKDAVITRSYDTKIAFTSSYYEKMAVTRRCDATSVVP
jgi:hypothetical protein